MQQPDGRPSSAVAKRQSRTVNGLKVTLVDVPGTYVAEMTPGASQRHNSPNFHLRAAVIETANGPYFIKLTGPAKTVAASEKQFEAFLGSVKLRAVGRACERPMGGRRGPDASGRRPPTRMASDEVVDECPCSIVIS